MDRVRSHEVAALAGDTETTPAQMGSLLILEAGPDGAGPDGAATAESVRAVVADRLALVPRYRQRLYQAPGGLTSPAWSDDPDFDLDYHVRRSALPAPGTREQLLALVGRLLGRPLERSRPLWEVYVIEGLQGGLVAVVTKNHQALVDDGSDAGRVASTDLAAVLLDTEPTPPQRPAQPWRPAPPPSLPDLVALSVTDAVRWPLAVFSRAAQVGFGLATGAVQVARQATRTVDPTPLDVTPGHQRRFAVTVADLDALREISTAHGGTVNDVLLAILAGALRSWLLTRGEPVQGSDTVRAMAPVAVRRRRGLTQVVPYYVDLPVGEPNPVVRLAQISHRMRGIVNAGRPIGAARLADLAGFAPPTLHALGARVTAALERRTFNVLVTNVPGPQYPLYLAGARLQACFPVVPLTAGHALSIGVTSYDGRVHVGLNADREALPDLDVVVSCLEESLVEMRETVP